MGESVAIAVGKLWAIILHWSPLVFGVALSHHIDKKSAAMALAAKLSSYFFGIGLAFVVTKMLVEKNLLEALTYEFALVQITTAAICVRVFAKKIKSLIRVFQNDL
jgi:hypothetical protein